MKTRTLTDVPSKFLYEVKDDFEREGCNVDVREQANGNYTVIAKCPESSTTKSIMDKISK